MTTRSTAARLDNRGPRPHLVFACSSAASLTDRQQNSHEFSASISAGRGEVFLSAHPIASALFSQPSPFSRLSQKDR